MSDAAPVDARASLERLARRLEAAHEADPGNAPAARVLKDVLLALGAGERGGDADEDDPLAELAELADAVP